MTRFALALALCTAAAPCLAAEKLSTASAAPDVATLQARVVALEKRLARLEGGGDEDEPKTEGVIPHVLVGPKLGLALPAPSLGVEVKAFRWLGASFDYGLIPDLDVSGAKLGFRTWNVGAKVYPFRGTFFIGALYGSYRLRGSRTDASAGGGTATLEVTTPYVAPQLGWRSVGSSGFFTSFTAGWAFPLKYQSTLDVPAGVSPGTLKDVHDNADQYLKKGLPLVGLFEMGWFI